MKKSSLSNGDRRLYSVLAVSAVLLCIVIGMILHTQALSSRIASLEKEATARSVQLTAYKRTLCSTVNTVEKLSTYSLQSAGYARSYRVHIPANYDPSVRYPLIVSFDGIEGSGTRMESYSGLDELPAVVVYPDALPGKSGFTAWQGAPYSVDGDRDVQFVSDILKSIPSRYCVDSTRVYAVGMSNGGAFANTVSCKLGDQIKAVASVSGAYYSACKPEERTPSLLVVHSTDDRQAPFKGVTVRRLPPVPQYVEKQVVDRHCKTVAEQTKAGSTIYYKWSKCDDNSSMQFIVVNRQPHGWLALPQVSHQRTTGTAGYVWNFFEESSYQD